MKLSCRIMLNSLDRRRRERSELWSDDTPPHGHAAWRGARSGQMSRGAEPSEAQLHEGASEPAVDTCCLSPVWKHGLPLRQ